MSDRRKTVERNARLRMKLRARVLREESVCWLCGHEVDKSLPASDPMHPQLDHVVPVSKGGKVYDRDNARLSHALCNRKRGNKDASQAQVSLFPAPPW